MNKFKIAFMKQPIVDNNDKALLLSQIAVLFSYISVIIY
jgi:hypothetical protein